MSEGSEIAVSALARPNHPDLRQLLSLWWEGKGPTSQHPVVQVWVGEAHLRLIRRDKAPHHAAHDARHRISEGILAVQDILGRHIEPGSAFPFLHLIPIGLLPPRMGPTAVSDTAANFPLCVLQTTEPGAEFGVGITAGWRSSVDGGAHKHQRDSRSDKMSPAGLCPDDLHAQAPSPGNR